MCVGAHGAGCCGRRQSNAAPLALGTGSRAGLCRLLEERTALLNSNTAQHATQHARAACSAGRWAGKQPFPACTQRSGPRSRSSCLDPLGTDCAVCLLLLLQAD